MSPSALAAHAADLARIAGELARAAAEGAHDPDEHLSLDEARALGKFKSARPIKEAGRAGHLKLYGTERTRTVKRGEFVAWLESRRGPVVAGPADADIERRVARLGRKRRAG